MNRSIVCYLKIDKMFITVIFSKIDKGSYHFFHFSIGNLCLSICLRGYAVDGAIFVSRIVSKVFQNLLTNIKHLSDIIF